MATHPLQALTPSAINLVTALSLSSGDSLAVQVRGQRAAMYFEGGASAPADRNEGAEQLPGRWAYFTVGSDPIWYWAAHADGTNITVSSS